MYGHHQKCTPKMEALYTVTVLALRIQSTFLMWLGFYCITCERVCVGMRPTPV